MVEGEDRDSNGFVDFERTSDYDAVGLPTRVRETETDNGGEPPTDPATFRFETTYDEFGNPTSQEEGPDDDSPRTETTWEWNYIGSILQHEADVDRRNNGEDLVHWTLDYSRDGRLTTWEIDATETTGFVTKLSYLWEGDGVVEVVRFDSLNDGSLGETGRWRRENDAFGRVLRMVEVDEAGVEGRQAVYTRDDVGRLERRVGGWGTLGEWNAAEVQYSRTCP